MPNPKEIKQRIDATLKAWEENAPTTKLYNLTLAEYKAKVQASLDARDELERIGVRNTAALTVRDNADVASHDWTLKIAGAVRSDPNFGENSPLYAALGYVTKNARESGLTRAATEPPAPTLKVAA